MDKVILKAEKFATIAHEGQTENDAQKTPYIFHPKKVAELVTLSGGNKEEISSAWLHDVVEDTPVTIETIAVEFGSEIADIVSGLTDLPEFSGLPIEERKQRQADRVLNESNSVKRVKLADQISTIELDGSNSLLDKDHRKKYVEGAKKIADNCKGVSPFLDNTFASIHKKMTELLNG